MSITVSTNITVKIQGKTIEMTLEEAKELHKELGNIVAPYNPLQYTPSPAPIWKGPYTVGDSMLSLHDTGILK